MLNKYLYPKLYKRSTLLKWYAFVESDTNFEKVIRFCDMKNVYFSPSND